MDPDRYNDDSTVDLLDSIEACLARIKDRIDVHGSAESAERALAEVRRRLSDEEAERLRGEIAGRIELERCRAEFHDSDIARRDAEIARLRVEAAQARYDALSHAVRRATGCLDYLGGLTGPGSEALLREYHAGMECVIRVLGGLRDGEDTTQTRALDAIGGAR